MNSDRTITISKHEVVLDRMFVEDVWELAFGADAWTKQFTDEEVSSKLREFSDKALAWDNMYEGLLPPDDNDMEDTEENYETREKMDKYLSHYPNNLPRLIKEMEDE
jgi:hypothetical protein